MPEYDTAQLSVEYVTYTGSREAQGPATWTQQETWSWRNDTPGEFHHTNKQFAMAITGDEGLPRLLAVVKYLVERHECLRTRFRLTDGVLVQEVIAAGCVKIPVWTLPEDVDLEEFATARYLELGETEFDPFQHELFKLVVVRQLGECHLLFCGSRFAIDGPGMALVEEIISAALAGDLDVAVADHRPTWQPLDQSGFETSEEGRRSSRTAVEHWRTSLIRARTSSEYKTHEPENPRYRVARLYSTGIAAALDVGAERYRWSTATVALAAVSTVLAEYFEIDHWATQVVVSNRFFPHLKDALFSATQNGFVLIDSLDAEFSDLARRVHTSLLRACRYARFEHEPQKNCATWP